MLHRSIRRTGFTLLLAAGAAAAARSNVPLHPTALRLLLQMRTLGLPPRPPVARWRRSASSSSSSYAVFLGASSSSASAATAGTTTFFTSNSACCFQLPRQRPTRPATTTSSRTMHASTATAPFTIIATASAPFLRRFSPHSPSLFLHRNAPTLRMTSTAEPDTTNTNTPATGAVPFYENTDGDDDGLKGIVWVQSCVVDVLNELFDAQQVARAKRTNNNKTPKKKKANCAAAAANDGMKEDAATTTLTMTPAEGEQNNPATLAATDDAPVPTAFTAADAMVTVATKAEFGDYQCNAALGLASALNMSPRQCAAMIVDALSAKKIGGPNSVLQPPEIAGPGFVNLRYTNEYLSRAVARMAADPVRLAVPLSRRTSTTATAQRQRIVVDYSSPNIAKEMHVGHLRSTILGDTLANVLEFAGHSVVRLNHIGDWGTQFGMLVEHLRDEYPAALRKETAGQVDLGDLVLLYKAAKQRFDVDADFKQRAREGVVKLQAGDVEALAAWESLCHASRVEYHKIYDLLGIRGLVERGESFYNPMLQNVVADLSAQGLAVESDGALAVFLDGYTNRDGSPLPLLVRKSDGGFNYATTDLAAIRHRTSPMLPNGGGGEQADRILYVTDAGQSQHFEMVFAAAAKANFVAAGEERTCSLEHVPFGLVQGADGKKFATRSGETVKLKDLLNEAVRIAGQDMRERHPVSGEDGDGADEFRKRVDRVARIVGIGAVKYADLSMNRESNYRFSFERMLSLNGNTAPYMLYAYARICGIVRKASGQQDGGDGDDDGAAHNGVVWPEVAAEILITHETETDLMRNLVKLPDVLSEVERDLYPNRICDYLFETSQKFNKFYEHCSVNNAETPELKASRLSLCTATAGTIRLLLTLLGIEVVEKL